MHSFHPTRRGLCHSVCSPSSTPAKPPSSASSKPPSPASVCWRCGAGSTLPSVPRTPIPTTPPRPLTRQSQPSRRTGAPGRPQLAFWDPVGRRVGSSTGLSSVSIWLEFILCVLMPTYCMSERYYGTVPKPTDNSINARLYHWIRDVGPRVDAWPRDKYCAFPENSSCEEYHTHWPKLDWLIPLLRRRYPRPARRHKRHCRCRRSACRRRRRRRADRQLPRRRASADPVAAEQWIVAWTARLSRSPPPAPRIRLSSFVAGADEIAETSRRSHPRCWRRARRTPGRCRRGSRPLAGILEQLVEIAVDVEDVVACTAVQAMPEPPPPSSSSSPPLPASVSLPLPPSSRLRRAHCRSPRKPRLPV